MPTTVHKQRRPRHSRHQQTQGPEGKHLLERTNATHEQRVHADGSGHRPSHEHEPKRPIHWRNGGYHGRALHEVQGRNNWIGPPGGHNHSGRFCSCLCTAGAALCVKVQVSMTGGRGSVLCSLCFQLDGPLGSTRVADCCLV